MDSNKFSGTVLVHVNCLWLLIGLGLEFGYSTRNLVLEVTGWSELVLQKCGKMLHTESHVTHTIHSNFTKVWWWVWGMMGLENREGKEKFCNRIWNRCYTPGRTRSWGGHALVGHTFIMTARREEHGAKLPSLSKAMASRFIRTN